MLNRLLLLSALCLVWTPIASAIGPEEKDPRKIMEAADARKTPRSTTAKMAMLVVDDTGRKRKRLVKSRSAKFGEDTYQFMEFLAPADVQGTGLLSYDYDDGKRDDDQWLYMPSLRKSTRISAGDKSGSFMGTDLSYSDMTSKDPKSYSYVMVKESVTYKGEDCWLIKSTPETKKEKDETGYAFSLVWMSKEKLMPLKVHNELTAGQKIKVVKFPKIEKVKEYWVVKKIVARTKRGKETLSKTTIVLKDVTVDEKSFQKTDFSQSVFGR